MKLVDPVTLKDAIFGCQATWRARVTGYVRVHACHYTLLHNRWTELSAGLYQTHFSRSGDVIHPQLWKFGSGYETIQHVSKNAECSLASWLRDAPGSIQINAFHVHTTCTKHLDVLLSVICSVSDVIRKLILGQLVLWKLTTSTIGSSSAVDDGSCNTARTLDRD